MSGLVVIVWAKNVVVMLVVVVCGGDLVAGAATCGVVGCSVVVAGATVVRASVERVDGSLAWAGVVGAVVVQVVCRVVDVVTVTHVAPFKHPRS